MRWILFLFLAFLPCLSFGQAADPGSPDPRIPREERAVSNFDLGVNKVNYVHARWPELNGKGLAVSVKELSMDSTDIDYRDRYRPSPVSSSLISTHATTMASIIAGSGNSFYTGKGVAWQAGLSSSSFFNLMPDEAIYFQTSGITVQNHSYGLDIENFYGAEAEAYDRQVFAKPELIHVFSAGNAGEETSEEGPYAGIPGFANLTGTMKMAKNVLTVGAIDSFFQVEARSSRGPAFDGRLKPELVAFGQDGSSGAAAITSGLVLLLQQAYQEQHKGELPAAALLRAVLLNSADDLGRPGPDYVHGFGNVDAAGAIKTIMDGHFFKGAVVPQGAATFEVIVPENAGALKVTLAWTDPAAAVDVDQALINDLDLRLIHPASGEQWQPWVLSAAPSIDSLIAPARPGRDSLNNQEQITLALPVSGTYEITVSGHQLPAGAQEFFIAYEWETANRFEWLFPTRQDNFRPGERLPLRWESTLKSPTGKIEYALVGSEEWTVIDEAVDLSQPYLLWAAPDTIAMAQIRLTTGEQTFHSDTFTISQPLRLSLEVDCEEELLFSWEGAPGAQSYTLYGLGESMLQPVLTLTDTFALLNRAEYPYDHFAIEPRITPERSGLRSRTLNLEFQNAGCYIRSFFASLDEDQGAAELNLSLGSLFGVESVFFEKRQGGTFVQLTSLLPVDGRLEYQHIDRTLDNANNYYRAGVRLTDGRIFYSEEISIYYLRDSPFVLFPNPVSAGQDILIRTKEINGGEYIYLYDALGRLLLKYDLLTRVESISTTNFMAGVYFYEIRREEERLGAGRILVGGTF